MPDKKYHPERHIVSFGLAVREEYAGSVMSTRAKVGGECGRTKNYFILTPEQIEKERIRRIAEEIHVRAVAKQMEKIREERERDIRTELARGNPGYRGFGRRF